MTRASPCDTCRVDADCCILNEVPLTQHDAKRLEAHTGLPRSRFAETHDGWLLLGRADGPCPFFRHGRCSVHPGRPEACRLYPFTSPGPAPTGGSLPIARDHTTCPHAHAFARPADLATRMKRLVTTLDQERAARRAGAAP